MAGGGRFKSKGGIASHGEAVVEDGALLITGVVVPPAAGFPQEPWFLGMSTRSMWDTDFLGGTAAFHNDVVFPVSAGGGAVAFNPAGLDLTNHPGIVGLTTEVTAAGRVFLLSNTPAGYHFGFGRTRTGTWLETSALLSTALQRYTLLSGWFSITLPNTILFGVGFEYQDNQNGGRWQAITADGIGETSTDTGVLVTASTWFKLEAEVNAAGTSVDFFIDNVLVATNVTDIPSGTGFSNFYNNHIMKLVGTAARTLYVDAAYGYQEVVR